MISYFELPEDDQPPERVWLDDDRLLEWFEAVKSRRRAEAKGLTPLDIDDGEVMEQNELTKDFTR